MLPYSKMQNIKRGNIFNAKILKFNTSDIKILGHKNDFTQHTKFTWANKIIPLTIDIKFLEFLNPHLFFLIIHKLWDSFFRIGPTLPRG